MKRSKIGFFGLALGGLLLLGAEAHAIPVSYTATGVFTGGTTANTPVFTAPGVLITYTPPGVQNIDTPTNVSFGSFSTAGTVATSPVPVSTGFTLTITEISPTLGGTATFTSTISGTLDVDSSTAVLRFNAPLAQSIGLNIYEIANAAFGVPGQILIGAPTSGPINNRGVTAIEGRVTTIPEPSAMVLVGMGAVAPIALMGLRRRRANLRAAA